MKKSLAILLFIAGILLMVVPDAFVFYLIMPVPTSQESDQIELAHSLYGVLWPIRIIGCLMVLPYLLHAWRIGSSAGKIFSTVSVITALGLIYLLTFRFSAEERFKEPEQLIFLPSSGSTVPENNYVMGVAINGEAKAYPLKIVGYHHKIQDTVGGKPILVTYCTMCRTGMVYDPIVNGIHQQFRLVGAAFNNAIMEDFTSKSWWYQSTGIAGAGLQKGTALEVIPYQQVTLSSWIQQYPNTVIMQPDPKFVNQYAKLKNYDITVPAVNTDPARNKSFLPNSWVVGVLVGDSSKVFLWNELTVQKVINTEVDNQSIVLALEKDGYSFHAWKSSVADTAITFLVNNEGMLTDKETSSVWNWKGECTSGIFVGKKLAAVPAYQTYYHSWERFYDRNHKQSPYSAGNNKTFTFPSTKP